jgi:hypothetical protein
MGDSKEEAEKMRKAISVCFTLVLLGLLLTPLLAQATSTIPSHTYYGNGDYDGSLWYNATDYGAEGTTESQQVVFPTFQTCNFTLYRAQTFTPTSTQKIVSVSFWGYAMGGGVSTLWTEVQTTVAGEPSGVLLDYAEIDLSAMPTSVTYGWFTCNFTTQYVLTQGVMYSFVISCTGAADSVMLFCGGTGYDRGSHLYSDDSGVNWANTTYDMGFILSAMETPYSVARQSTIGNISQNIVCAIGQSYSSTYNQYLVSRGALFFDTSNLITTDNIQSATLEFWVESDDSDTNFDITAVDGSGLNGPLQTSDYYELRLNTDSKGSVGTAGISTTGYTTITITDLSIINKVSYTKIGLRSSRDIAGTIPTGNEYVSIYMGESIHPPILTVNYTVGELGIPDEMGFGKVCVYSGYRQVADEIFVWQNTLLYETEPDIGPTEYFVVQLLASDNSVIAQTVVNDWGYTPLSIYLDNITATTILPWKTDCSLLLTGSSLYGTPGGFTPHRYELDGNDWRGLVEPWKPPDKSQLDGWCKATTRWMEQRNGVDKGTYFTTGPEGQWCFHPYEAAGAMFIEGLPYINSVRPALFVFSGTSLNPGTPIAGTWASGIYTSVWGTYWSTAFLNLAGGWGLAGQWVIGIIWGFVVASLGGLARQLTGDPNISLVIMFFGAIIGVALGSIAMSIALVITIILWGAFLHNVLLSRT